MGTCENFDPGVWDGGFYEYVSQQSWGMGVGPLPSDIEDVLLRGDDGTDTDGDGVVMYKKISNMVGGFVYTTTSGSGEIYPYNYGFVYELLTMEK